MASETELAALASAVERIEEAVAVLGGLEHYDDDDVDEPTATMLRLGRVAVQKIREAQRDLERIAGRFERGPLLRDTKAIP